ncbi:hypothetical protein DAPPUDRAFT_306407 [Daphnia pulex]|uniref:WAP domain-containing protein n=1 Tax=Daphnia pulex TaxID=6669 RepID=E9FYL9_DAPPU|nr:hypothetical protein DAPPUDRAFT_306407 [Daphnia pulex]|eukprot:EFX87553.1 hypothetical protein DAPPUDRAFT_306407 [Daphnia pulex]
MFQKVFLFACILAVMAVVYTNSAPTSDDEATGEESDQFLFYCRWFTSCSNSTQCSSNLIHKTCNGGRCCRG